MWGAAAGRLDVDQFTGGLRFAVPVFASPCRAVAPVLALAYRHGAGDGAFGLDFDVAVPRIARRTLHRLPSYDDQDGFTLSSDDLVPRQERRSADGAQTITTFCERTEGAFARIERWTRSDGDVHWRVTDRDGTTHVFGASASARVADPDDARRVFEWLLEETRDPSGDRVAYRYRGDDVGAARYLDRVLYGAHRDVSDAERWHFELIFDYGERDPARPSYAPAQPWRARADARSSYRSGFEVRTRRLCRGIWMFHRFAGEPFPVHALLLDYDEDERRSLLVSIQEIGFRSADDGTIASRAMPALRLAYTRAQELRSPSHGSLGRAEAQALDGLVDAEHELIDLYGEGLPGILQGGTPSALYWRPLGGGRYAPPVPVGPLRVGASQMIDLRGDGRLAMVTDVAGGAGFHLALPDGTWGPFQPFQRVPARGGADGDRVLVDLCGTGRPDVAIFDDEGIAVHRSLGFEGFAPAVRHPRPRDFPRTMNHSPEEIVRFADMFGDGGAHLVRIRSGLVEVWPGLGHGRFGEKVVLVGAPRWAQPLDPSRLFLVDADGTGTTDLVYVGRDRIEIYYNRCGSSFSDAVVVPLPRGHDDLVMTEIADVRGVGAPALVLYYRDGETRDVYHALPDAGATLLAAVDDGSGVVERVIYRSSTALYLEDRASGVAWRSTMHAAVPVVTELEVEDAIADCRIRRRFAYHDGYVDPLQRELAGFARVETQVGTLQVKRWFHTGAWLDDDAFGRRTFVAGDRGDPDAQPLTVAALDASLAAADAATLAEAARTLRGHLLREEVYGIDGTAEAEHPYAITQHGYALRLVQPAADGGFPSCLASLRETLVALHERSPTDPRIEHSVITAVGPYGEIERTAHVAYPRREATTDPRWPEQRALTITATTTRFASSLDGSAHLLGVPCETRRFEIGGVALAAGATRFELEALARAIDDALANPIAFDRTLSGTRREARLLDWQRHLYWDAAQRAPLPLGAVVAPTLLHHTEAAVAPRSLFETVFGDRVDDATLARDGGYRIEDGVVWNPGVTHTYLGAAGLYLPTRVRNAFGAETVTTYDPQLLAPAEIVDAAGNTARASLDEHTLLPWRVVDPNENVSEMAFDPLGVVVATARYGTVDGRMTGDGPLSELASQRPLLAGDALAAPATALARAGTRVFYDLDAWRRDRTAPSRVHLERIDGGDAPTLDDDVRVTVEYLDGRGEVLQRKVRIAATRWWVSGAPRYDDRGAAIGRHQPYFSPSPAHDADPAVARQGPSPRIEHDALQRPIRVHAPSGYFTRIVRTPWTIDLHDENDTVDDAVPTVPAIDVPEERATDAADALAKAAAHAGTPMTHVFDSLGRCIGTVERLAASADAALLVTRHLLDVLGRPLEITNPRELRAITYVRQMNGEILLARSAEAGERRALVAAHGEVARSWDARGFECRITRDRLRRPVEIRVSGDDGRGLVLDHVVEHLRWGEDEPDAANRNLRGQLATRHDPAGLLRIEACDLFQRPIRTTRQLRRALSGELDWSTLDDLLLEPEVYRSVMRRDRFGELVEETHPDGQRVRWRRSPDGNLAGVEVVLGDGTVLPVVTDIVHDARGERRSMRHGNGVVETHDVDPLTLRLVATRAVRAHDQRLLQDIRYTYDPAGNPTRIRDRSHQTLLAGQERVEALRDYTCDALYRLVRATGIEGAGVRNAADPAPLTPFIERYTLDEVGNLLQIAHEGATSWNRRFTVSPTSDRAVPATMLSAGGSVDDHFDAHGNLLAAERLRAIRWNQRDQVAAVEVDDRVVHYLRQPDGRALRRSRERGGVVEHELVDLGPWRLRRAGPGPRARWLHVTDGGRLLAVVHTLDGPAAPLPDVRHFLVDHLGSITSELDARGELLVHRAYAPHGATSVLIAAGGAAPVGRGYSGEPSDDEAELYDYGARLYAPWLARWLSPDPIGLNGGLHLYELAGGNPIARVDVGGLMPKSKAPPKRIKLKPHPASKPVRRTHKSSRSGGYESDSDEENTAHPIRRRGMKRALNRSKWSDRAFGAIPKNTSNLPKTTLVADAAHIHGQTDPGGQGRTTVTLMVVYDTVHQVFGHFAFGNKLLPQAVRADAEARGYHVIQTEQEHAEMSALEYLLTRSHRYEFVTMAVNREHCAECYAHLEAVLGAKFGTMTMRSGKVYGQFKLSPEIVAEAAQHGYTLPQTRNAAGKFIHGSV